ncbi:MAG TPA: PilZ domain-containing protein [Marinobacterium sp.]|nr:PilZ domain-containing protein [Marinobacterium sp.]
MRLERRLTPRVFCDIAAEIDMLFGDSIDVQIVDLSSSGCQIRGDQRLTRLDSIASGAPLEFSLNFGLEGCPIHTFCRMIYKRRETQNSCLMGLRWNSVPEHQMEILQRFIDQHLVQSSQSSAKA